jgi:hypothetical protein
MTKGYPRSELSVLGPQRTFAGDRLNQIVFPIGDIGTGSVGLMGRGGLCDGVIFNRPNFGGRFPYTFPILYAKERGKGPVCRVLEGPVPAPHVGGGGGSGGAGDRHDGVKRNPWDEFECGHHYARAMSSYGLLNALSGFTFNKGTGALGFEPRIHPNRFKTFWALDGTWGTYAQSPRKAVLTVLHGTFVLSRLDLRWMGQARPGNLYSRPARRPRACGRVRIDHAAQSPRLEKRPGTRRHRPVIHTPAALRG